MCVPGSPEIRRGLLNPLGLELQIVVNFHVGVEIEFGFSLRTTS